jgi:hypothetical protein
MNSYLKVAAVVAATGCLVLLMSGCASSSLVDKWHDPGYQAPPLGKILVIAVRKNETKRRLWEDAFAGELAKRYVTATTSYSLFPDAPPDTDQVKTTVQANNYDAILVILRLPSEKDLQYIHGSISSEQDRVYNFYWKRYWVYYREIEHSGYVDSQTVAISAIDVTTTGSNGRLIWGATSRTPDPGSVTDLQTGIAGLAASELSKLGIIGSKK